jgi:hypothetical protein
MVLPQRVSEWQVELHLKVWAQPASKQLALGCQTLSARRTLEWLVRGRRKGWLRVHPKVLAQVRWKLLVVLLRAHLDEEPRMLQLLRWVLPLARLVTR